MIEQFRNSYLRQLKKPENPWNSRARVRNFKPWNSIPMTEGYLDASLQNHHGKVWVWSDLHFGHKNIIRYSERPYPNVETMDFHLIENFNDYVEPEDVSVWVGDVSFHRDIEKTRELVGLCNGYKILVVGNHDFGHHSTKVKDMGFDEVHLLMIYQDQEINVLFTHYPIDVDFPWVNVHGHQHAKSFVTKYTASREHINVCCELHQYKPIEFDTIKQWARTRTISYDKK